MGNEYLTKKDLREELGEFTEQVLLPAVERIIDERVPRIIDERVPRIIDQKIGAHRDQMIDYIDRRLSSATGEIVAAIRGDRERDRVFKTKLVDLLKRRQLLDEHELLIFQELIP